MCADVKDTKKLTDVLRRCSGPKAYPVGILDVGEALRLVSVAVLDDAHVLHLAGLGEELKQVTLIGLQGQIEGKHGADIAIQLTQLTLPLTLLANLRRCSLLPAKTTAGSALELPHACTALHIHQLIPDSYTLRPWVYPCACTATA